MAIPKIVKIKHGKLPTIPGVYLFKDKKGKVVYVGKATNLKSRVSSYWKNTNDYSLIRANRRIGRTIDEMLHEVARIDWVTTDSVIEALILEANLIRKYMPRYNVKEKDDKSFLYVVVTREQWPKVELVRGQELKMQNLPAGKAGKKSKIFGPYTSASSIRAALDLIRKWFPWSTCVTQERKNKRTKGQKSSSVPQSLSPSVKSRPCFDYHIGRCPGVCAGAVTRKAYMKNIRNVILMLEGKKSRVLRNVEQEMKQAAKTERFEEAEKLRRKLFALQHIRDIAVITKDTFYDRHLERSAAREVERSHTVQGMRFLHSSAAADSVEMTDEVEVINIFGRIEGYDISNISGTNAVGSMVVFENGEAKKSEYRKFKIKTVQGINDVAMMREVLERRFRRSRVTRARDYESTSNKNSQSRKLAISETGSWPLPDLILIDGGWGQVNVALGVIKDLGLKIPVVGIAKGFDRKQDQPIFQKGNSELARVVENYKNLFLRVRDEAHRFAVSYHRKLRSRITS